MINVLITGVGGPTPRSFARSIKEIGTYSTYRLIGTDIHPYAIGLYQSSLFDECVLTPKSSHPDYWRVMEDVIKRFDIDMAIILPEQEVLAWSVRQETGELPCKALIPPLKAVENMLDKGILNQMLSTSGLVPNSVIIYGHEKDLKSRTERELSYPYWIRSATGSSGLGSYKIECFEDLERWMAINKNIDQFIASEYLPGRNLACKLLYFEGKLLRSACAERVQYIMAKVAPSGITGNTSFGRLINDQGVFEVAQEAMNTMFSKLDIVPHGFYTVDLKEDIHGKPKITEINVRHVAFTQCLALGGANICEDTVRLLDEDASFDTSFTLYSYEEGLIFLRDVDERPMLMKESDLLF